MISHWPPGDHQSACPQEVGVALFKPLGVGAICRPPRKGKQPAVDLLQADDEHRSVVLVEDRLLDLDHVVRSDREEESVERSVMQLAERHESACQSLRSVLCATGGWGSQGARVI